MPRPCTCNRIPATSTTSYEAAVHCPLCTVWHYHPDSAAARAWRGEAFAKTKPSGRKTQRWPLTPQQPARVNLQPPVGVGTHLHRILTTLGLTESSGCACKSMRTKMDNWGPVGCRNNRDEIETHLRNEASKVGWLAKLKAGVVAATHGLVLNPVDPIPSLLDAAITQAETDQPPTVQTTTPDPWTHPITVPQPPPFTGRVTSSRCLVTVAANDKGRQLLTVSKPMMERYAAELNVDFHILDWPGPSDWPMGSKFALSNVVSAYERTLYADADVLFRPDCLNLFDQSPADVVAGVCDWAGVSRTYPPFHAEYRRFLRYMGLGEPDPIPWYLNTGLLVLPKAAASLMVPPTKPIPPLWCGEQHWWNGQFLQSEIPVHILPPRCNYQWWAHEPTYWQTAPRKPGGFKPPSNAPLHFSGPTDTDEKLKLMRKWLT